MQVILKAIESYRSKIKAWQDTPNCGRWPTKKPKMPASIRGQFTDRLKSEIAKDWAYIHQKKRRLGILSHRLTALDAAKQASLCFGGKAYFRHQFHLDKAEIDSHEESLEGIRQRERFSPTDLMGAALVSCILTTMALVAERDGVELKGVTASVVKEMNPSPQRIKSLPVEVLMPAGLTEIQRQKLENAARACPVHASLHPSIEAPIVFHYS